MSKFAARMVAGLSAIYDRLGDDAVYADSNGGTADCVAIVEHDLQDYGDSQTVAAGTVVIRVRCSEIAARPRREDVFTMVDAGDSYSVIRPLVSSDEFEHRLLAK